MEPAVDTMRELASGMATSAPTLRIWTNRDGSVVDDGAHFLDLLVGQIASPVRWDRVKESFTAAGVTGLIERSPAGALVGLAKRALKGLPTLAVKTPDDIPAAHALIDQETAA
jgi:[acyl-carrier-protein] S-malonyltransferase